MGEFIKTQTTDHIAYIGLNREHSNALHLEMIDELTTEVQAAQNDPAIEAVVLHGKEGFFSAGADLITLYAYDNERIKRFWARFIDLTYELLHFPKPLIASISGHAPAGGCVLAICCDYRIMADGEYIIGLNETAIGIPVPPYICRLYSEWLGPARAYRSLLQGKLFVPKEALEIGLIDQLVPPNRIHTVATQQAKIMMQFEKNTWAITKNNLRKTLLHDIQQSKILAAQQILEQWWKPSTRNILKTIIDNLTRKKV